METPNKIFKSSLFIKSVVIVAMILLLLIPMAKVNELIEERHHRSEEVQHEISSKWGKKQAVTGPILAIPYVYSLNNLIVKYIYLVPEKLTINGSIDSQIKKRGIYETVVYDAQLHFTGGFDISSIEKLAPKGVLIQYDKAVLATRVSDFSRITENVQGTFADMNVKLTAASHDAFGDSYTPLFTTVCLEHNDKLDFDLSMNFKGVDGLSFNSLAKQMDVELKSDWTNPSFQGTRVTDKTEVSEEGFVSSWKFLNQRNYNGKFSPIRDTYEDHFGVTLMMANDHYSKSNRSAKYAILLIGLTYVAFFFIELLNKKNIHPLQYALIGLALCLFYTLLVSFSEHVNFNISYLISTVMTVGLIGVYAKAILGSVKLSAFMIVMQSLVYGFIFLIIQLQDFALVAGSLGLFIILGLMMYFSKKIDFKK
jgi:inner membrane protein